MDRKIWGRRLVVVLGLVLGLLLIGATVTLAAPDEKPEDWCTGYVVRKGDTVSGIAWRYGVSWQAVAHYNGLHNPNYVRAGQCLYIPPKAHYSYYKPTYYNYYKPTWHYVPGHWQWHNGYWVYR